MLPLLIVRVEPNIFNYGAWGLLRVLINVKFFQIPEATFCFPPRFIFNLCFLVDFCVVDKGESKAEVLL
jgi:hypothetical protein